MTETTEEVKDMQQDEMKRTYERILRSQSLLLELAQDLSEPLTVMDSEYMRVKLESVARSKAATENQRKRAEDLLMRAPVYIRVDNIPGFRMEAEAATIARQLLREAFEAVAAPSQASA